MAAVHLTRVRELLAPRRHDDPVSVRVLHRAMHVQLGVPVALLGVVTVVPGIPRYERVEMLALLAALIPFLAVVMLTIAGRRPVVAFTLTTASTLVTIFVATLVVPDVMVAGLLSYAIVVAATTTVAGLGLGLATAAIATLGACVAQASATTSLPKEDFTLVFAAIAYVAIASSVEGYTRERRRTADQLARLHSALRVVVAAPSLDATLSAIVAAVERAVGASSAAVLLREGDHLVLAAPRVGDERWSAERIARSTAKELASQASPIGAATASGETVVVRDIATETRFPRWAQQWMSSVGRYGLRSLVAVPLRSGSERIGLLYVCFARVGALGPDDLALLEAYAEQVSLVLARARAYAELEAADAMKSEFLATVSHELRTPLTAAKGFVDTVLLHWDRLEDDQRRRLLRRASRNSDELARLIDQLLDYSRLDAGRMAMVPVAVDAAALVDEALERTGPLLADHLVVVDVDDRLVVDVDRDAFGHVLANLLTNAAKFSPSGSAIRVTGRRDAGFAVISVHDQGLGIAPADHERIFERFVRVEAASAGRRGAGMGLAIVERYVALLGGEVWVDSRPGDGSVFSFTVPVVAPGGGSPPEPSTTSARPPVQEYS